MATGVAFSERHGAGANADGDEVARLVRAAADGDSQAWNALVDRYKGLVWAVTRSTRLGEADAADVCQTTWLRLVEHLDRIEKPECVGAWLATTARRECYRVRRRRDRDVLTGEDRTFDTTPGEAPAFDQRLIADERDGALRAAFARLSPRARALLVLLNADPPIPYVDISRTLGVPIGSIGPTRARVLAKLRRHAEALGISKVDACSSA